jgi:hypothetical protein
MDVTLKNVEANDGYIVFTCPKCGADAHVQGEDGHELYWMVRSMEVYVDDVVCQFRDGKCKVCGCKREVKKDGTTR